MYTPIPDAPDDMGAGLSSGEAITMPENNKEDSHRNLLISIHRLLWQTFLGSFVVACLVFGVYICSFYLSSLARNKMEVWDWTAPGMYRKNRFDGNWAIGVHFIGGAYLMLLGPLQFVPWIRRHCMRLHRWNGRMAIFVGTFGTALGGISYILLVGGANVGIVGQPANWNNLVFGASMLVCGIQTYRHAAITKQIDQHKRWAYLTASLGLGSIYIRIGTTFMPMVLKLDDSDPQVFYQAQANSEIFKCGLNFLIFTNHIPFLILANEVWKLEHHQQQQQPSQQGGEQNPTRTVLCLTLSTLVVVTFVLGVGLLLLEAWIPNIGRSLDDYNEGYGS